MLHRLVKTDSDYPLTISRFVLGALFFIHGCQLMLGWFGGYGLTGSIDRLLARSRASLPAQMQGLAHPVRT